MTQTGFVYDDLYLNHNTGSHHPERAQRLTAIIKALKGAGLLDKLFHIEPVPAKRNIVEMCHEPGYIDRFQNAVERSVPFLDTPECPLSPATFEAAICATGGILAGIDNVMQGNIKNCFCAVRPPGHHAERSKAMGFCYFNNIAIAAKYLQKQYSIERIAIIDWDVHHGNGTQHAFEQDPGVFYISFHQNPYTCYPGTGKASEIGTGKGQGYTLNFPMAPGAGNQDYFEAMETVEQKMENFRPEFVLISAGFDAHADDPLAHINLTTKGYEEMTRKVKGVAEDHSEGRVVSMLEGGYNLQALGESVKTHIQVLSEG